MNLLGIDVGTTGCKVALFSLRLYRFPPLAEAVIPISEYHQILIRNIRELRAGCGCYG